MMLPPNTASPLAEARVNLSVAIAMSPLPVMDVTASIAPPMFIPVADVVIRGEPWRFNCTSQHQT